MTSMEPKKRSPLMSWVGLSALCLASAVGGGILVSRFQARRAAMPPPESGGVSAATTVGSSDDEVKALRSEVARLGRAVGALAAKPGPTPAKSLPQAPTPLPPMPAPKEALTTKEDLLNRYTAALPNAERTRALESSIAERLKKEAFAADKINVEEVACRGDVCRARISYAEEAMAENIILELAAAVPDSHSFQDFAAAGDHRRSMTSVYLAN